MGNAGLAGQLRQTHETVKSGHQFAQLHFQYIFLPLWERAFA